ncbi:MAG: hypothetical protein ONB45_17020 [candidate division KSB1 bacterium]|nr:hypothetical protein [candidate division KSB1 bacterium]
MLKLRSNFAKKGYSLYKKLKPILEAEHLDEYVAIEMKSGDYFLGRSMGEALEKAEQKYPEAKFFVVKVGELATVSFKNF